MKTYREILLEQIKGWKHAQSDISRSRKQQRQEQMSVHIVRLNKNGAESGMHDAKAHFPDEKAALDKIEQWRKLNPGKDMNWNLYINGKLKGKV